MWKHIANDPLMQLGLILAGLAGLLGALGFWLFQKWGLLPPEEGRPKGSGKGGELSPLDRIASPRARLEVSPGGSLLQLPNGKRVFLGWEDYRALGEAGRYLAPGTVLSVKGIPKDKEALAAKELLEVMGLRVEFEGP
jgi:hypothetical protein